LILQSAKHLQLTVGLEAGEHAGGVIVVEKLPSKFHIELAAKCLDTLSDLSGLQTNILLVRKAFSESCGLGFCRHGVTPVFISVSSGSKNHFILYHIPRNFSTHFEVFLPEYEPKLSSKEKGPLSNSGP
jgi:hypothetical protein